jgi:hypothetical protein
MKRKRDIMLKKIWNETQKMFKSIMDKCKGLPLVVVILIIVAIIIIPDPLIIAGSIVLKKLGLIAL